MLNRLSHYYLIANMNTVCGFYNNTKKTPVYLLTF